VTAGGLGLVARARWWPRARWGGLAAGLAALQLAAWQPTFTGAPPVDLDAAPARILAYLVLLVAAWWACTWAAPSAR
jgi:hypothetical protein